jgi:hypothetical protein
MGVKERIMKKLKPLLLSLVMVLFTACGTETTLTPTRFDMWEYMTAILDYEVEYDIYENGVKVDYYRENHRLLSSNNYERESSNGVTSLQLNGNNILMREPSQDVSVERYVYLGDRGIFHAPTIRICSAERYYSTYERKGSRFHNVLMVECESKSGVHQQYFYGYNEGLVAIYENDGAVEREWIKVSERHI